MFIVKVGKKQKLQSLDASEHVRVELNDVQLIIEGEMVQIPECWRVECARLNSANINIHKEETMYAALAIVPILLYGLIRKFGSYELYFD